MDKISSDIRDLDVLMESLHIGEAEVGTHCHLFVQNFTRQAFSESKDVIYISFNKSPFFKLSHMRNTDFSISKITNT